VSSAAITLCVASQRVFIVVSVYIVIDSVRRLLDTPLIYWKIFTFICTKLVRKCITLRTLEEEDKQEEREW